MRAAAAASVASCFAFIVDCIIYLRLALEGFNVCQVQIARTTDNEYQDQFPHCKEACNDNERPYGLKQTFLDLIATMGAQASGNRLAHRKTRCLVKRGGQLKRLGCLTTRS